VQRRPRRTWRTSSSSAGLASPCRRWTWRMAVQAMLRVVTAVPTAARSILHPRPRGRHRPDRTHRAQRRGQCTSVAFTQRLLDEGIDPLSARPATPMTLNALAETIVGSFKNELIQPQGPGRDVDHVEIGTAEGVVWSRYAGDPLSGRPATRAGSPALIGACPWPSPPAWSAPLVLVGASWAGSGIRCWMPTWIWSMRVLDRTRRSRRPSI